MTPGEYLELERKSEIRSEYITGRMVAMPRSNLRHSVIVGNLLGWISTQLRPRDSQVLGFFRVKVCATDL